jgi:hypothetical protein
MAFPTIPSSGANTLLTSSQATVTTTHTFPSLTTLAQSSGDLMLAVIVLYRGSTANAEFSSWGGSFTELLDQSSNAVLPAIGVAYKWSDGTETGTFTVTSAGTQRSAMFLMTIPGAHPSTVPSWVVRQTGTTAAADPGAHDPTNWGAEDTLWIAIGASAETSLTGTFAGATAAPANYTGYLDTGIIGGDVIGAIEGAVAFRQLNTASENVGTFTVDLSAAANAALHVAVRPKSGARTRCAGFIG